MDSTATRTGLFRALFVPPGSSILGEQGTRRGSLNRGGSDQVSQILGAVGRGDAEAEQRLFQTVYAELRRMAHRQLASEKYDRTLQTTGLVHEAYLRLVNNDPADWENRRHFFGAAAQAMRRILIDRARERLAAKRDPGGKRVTLDDDLPDAQRPAELIALDEAVDRFTTEYPRPASVVKLRYYLGLTVKEVAEVMGIAPRTVDADWHLAKAWLRREIGRA